MISRRNFFRRAAGALAAGTLAGMSRWMPFAPEDGLVSHRTLVDQAAFWRLHIERHQRAWKEAVYETLKMTCSSLEHDAHVKAHLEFVNGVAKA